MSSSASKNKENISEEIKNEIKTQVEYYLSDENLKKDAFFHGLISSDANGYLDLEFILKCNKIKKKGWTKDDLIKGIEISNLVELDGSKKKVRRKNNLKLPELTLLNQKRKKEEKNNEEKKEEDKKDSPKKTKKEEDKKDSPKKTKKEEAIKEFTKDDKTILKITSDEISSVNWKTIFAEFKKLNPDLNVDYGRFKDNQGHIGIILKEGQNFDNINLTKNFEIEGKKFNVEKCEGESLDNFWKEHGSHYEYCVKQREKHNKTKERKNLKKKKYLDEKISLGGKEYCNIDVVKNETKKILSKYKDGEKVDNDDKNFLLDLLTYHHNYKEKIKNMDYIIVDRNEKYKFSRCFFIVDKDGNKADFSTKKCIESIIGELDDKEKEDK